MQFTHDQRIKIKELLTFYYNDEPAYNGGWPLDKDDVITKLEEIINERP